MFNVPSVQRLPCPQMPRTVGEGFAPGPRRASLIAGPNQRAGKNDAAVTIRVFRAPVETGSGPANYCTASKRTPRTGDRGTGLGDGSRPAPPPPQVYHRLGLPGPALAARRQQLRLAEAAAGPLGERCDALAGAGEAALAGRDLPTAADCFERELRASQEAGVWRPPPLFGWAF